MFSINIDEIIVCFYKLIHYSSDVIAYEQFFILPGGIFIIEEISHHMPIHFITAGISFPEPFFIF